MAGYRGGVSLSQTQERRSYNSDEEDNDYSPSRTGALFYAGDGSSSGTTPPAKRNSCSSEKAVVGRDSASTGEIVRKRRGRPPGSKNKPKPPVVVTRDSDVTAMRPIILEVSAGTDVIKMISEYSRRRQMGLCILSCSGTVANVTLRLPVSQATAVTLHGTFKILSLSATFLGSSVSSSSLKSSSSMIPSPPITISLGGVGGQVFGGTVEGSLTAASNVVLVVSTFVNFSFYRLPLGEEDETEENVNPSSALVVSGGVGSGSATNAYMSMNACNVQNPTPLNCQISPNVLSWPSTSRPPHY